MEIYFIILLTSALIVWITIVYKYGILTKNCLIKKKKIENYGLYKHDSIDKDQLDVILDNYSKNNIKKYVKSGKKTVYSKGNFERKIIEEVTPIINRVINNLNNIHKFHMKIFDIYRIEIMTDNEGNKQVLIIFDIHMLNNYTTTKLVLNYYVSCEKIVNINELKTEMRSLRGRYTDKLEPLPYYHLDSKDSFNKTIHKVHPTVTKLNLNRYDPLPNNFSTLAKCNQKLYPIQEPCNYNLHEWDRFGVNKQVKLHKKCTIGNNSDVMPIRNPYYNPTMYGPNMHMSGIEKL